MKGLTVRCQSTRTNVYISCFGGKISISIEKPCGGCQNNYEEKTSVFDDFCECVIVNLYEEVKAYFRQMAGS